VQVGKAEGRQGVHCGQVARGNLMVFQVEALKLVVFFVKNFAFERLV